MATYANPEHFSPDFNLAAFFSALPTSLTRSAKNGETHLKILKTQAKLLRQHLTQHGCTIGHAQALDLVTRSLGFADYNQAKAHVMHLTEKSEVQNDLTLNPGILLSSGNLFLEDNRQVLTGVDIPHLITTVLSKKALANFHATYANRAAISVCVSPSLRKTVEACVQPTTALYTDALAYADFCELIDAANRHPSSDGNRHLILVDLALLWNQDPSTCEYLLQEALANDNTCSVILFSTFEPTNLGFLRGLYARTPDWHWRMQIPEQRVPLNMLHHFCDAVTDDQDKRALLNWAFTACAESPFICLR